MNFSVLIRQVVQKKHAVARRKFPCEQFLRPFERGNDGKVFLGAACRKITVAHVENERFADEDDPVQPDERRTERAVDRLLELTEFDDAGRDDELPARREAQNLDGVLRALLVAVVRIVEDDHAVRVLPLQTVRDGENPGDARGDLFGRHPEKEGERSGERDVLRGVSAEDGHRDGEAPRRQAQRELRAVERETDVLRTEIAPHDERVSPTHVCAGAPENAFFGARGEHALFLLYRFERAERFGVLGAYARHHAHCRAHHVAKLRDIAPAARAHFGEEHLAVKPALVHGARNACGRVVGSGRGDDFEFFGQNDGGEVLDGSFAEAPRDPDFYGSACGERGGGAADEPVRVRHFVRLHAGVRKRQNGRAKERNDRKGNVPEQIDPIRVCRHGDRREREPEPDAERGHDDAVRDDEADGARRRFRGNFERVPALGIAIQNAYTHKGQNADKICEFIAQEGKTDGKERR